MNKIFALLSFCFFALVPMKGTYYTTNQSYKDKRELDKKLKQVHYDIDLISLKPIPLPYSPKSYQQGSIENMNHSCYYVNDTLAKLEVIYHENEEAIADVKAQKKRD